MCVTDINGDKSSVLSSFPAQDILRLLLSHLKNDCSRVTKDDTIDKLEHNKSIMFTCY